ncbi:MAG: hypothetical protein M9932_01515 [Xanthobacteraceae bacterium]|nr:hypothetical protein [Xanthobacteraceae bacterium]
MDNASAARARAAIERRGHTVTFKRVTGAYPNQTTVSKDVKAVVSGYKPEELINGITLGSRKIIVSEQALADVGFPVHVVKSDKITVQGKELSVEAVDRDRREWQGCLDIAAIGP